MSALYIHIPLCKSRCNYCDFYSCTALPSTEELLGALHLELQAKRAFLREPLRTIYIGGGTPSLLPAQALGGLLEQAVELWGGESLEEITLEANPDDLSREYLQQLRQVGFNRLSIGIQSFQDEHLRWMNRRHSAQEAIEAVGRAREAGFDNLSIDLIYGLPTLSEQAWEENLRQAVALSPEHISAYHLTIEPGTPFGRRLQRGELREISAEASLRHFDLLREHLTEAGYLHYELSNFAKAGHASKHNSSYWAGVPYLGVGASAHSYDGTSRYWNPSDLSTYLQNPTSCWEQEVLSENDLHNEYLMTRLRTASGIDLRHFEERFGAQKLQTLLHSAQRHLNESLLLRREGRLYIPAHHFFTSDRTIGDLFTLT